MLLLLAGLPGCSLVEEPVLLESVHDAPASEGKRLGVRGVAHPAFYGEYKESSMDRNIRARQMARFVVVPLLDPGETLPEAEVNVWLTHGHYMGELRHPTNEPFFERARELFDGKRQNVLRRLNTNPDAAWNKAVRDAVQRHGLRSHPDAVVIGLRRNVE